MAEPHVVQDSVAISAHPGLSSYAARPELVTLVLHQGHQGSHHDAQPTTDQGRELKTHALASACGHQGKNVSSTDQVLHWFHLVWSEVVKSPVRLQQAWKGLECV